MDKIKSTDWLVNSVKRIEYVGDNNVIIDGIEYEAVPDDTCTSCAFIGDGSICGTLCCSPENRPDKLTVKWRKMGCQTLKELQLMRERMRSMPKFEFNVVEGKSGEAIYSNSFIKQ